MVYELRSMAPPMQWARQGLGRLQQMLLPPRCVACGGRGQVHRSESTTAILDLIDLCESCLAQLPVNRIACRLCALPLSGTQSGLICGHCLKRPPPYQAGWCAFEYIYPVTHLIRRLKYGGALAPSRVLGELLAHYLRTHRIDPWPECFIPVPLHMRRYRERGYNQVIELGRHLEQALPIRMRTDLVTRIRHTPEQAGLAQRARKKNLHRAFATTTVALPRHVAVLDDVITTASTVNELGAVLKRGGVESIEVWGLARATANMKKST